MLQDFISPAIDI